MNGALYVLKIEKRNNELKGKDTAEGRRYVVLSQPAQELRRSRESYVKKCGRLPYIISEYMRALRRLASAVYKKLENYRCTFYK